MNNSKRIYRAAIYVRLSKEDGDLDDVRKVKGKVIKNKIPGSKWGGGWWGKSVRMTAIQGQLLTVRHLNL